MKNSFSKENIYKFLTSLEGYDNKEISESGVAYKVILHHVDKSVTVTWPYELGEVFLDFAQDEEIIFQDWFDCLDSDELKDFMVYLEAVTKRFLFNDFRITKVGKLFFKYSELQYYKESKWQNVLHP